MSCHGKSSAHLIACMQFFLSYDVKATRRVLPNHHICICQFLAIAVHISNCAQSSRIGEAHGSRHAGPGSPFDPKLSRTRSKGKAHSATPRSCALPMWRRRAEAGDVAKRSISTHVGSRSCRLTWVMPLAPSALTAGSHGLPATRTLHPPTEDTSAHRCASRCR